MRKIFFTFVAALGAMVVLEVFLAKFMPTDLGVLRTIAVAAPFPLIFTLFVLAFITAFSGDPNDLWQSRYFKFMRGFWGDLWGGERSYFDYVTWECRPREKSISVCSATWLSAIAFLFTLLFLCSIALFFYGIAQEWAASLAALSGRAADDALNYLLGLFVVATASLFVGFLLSLPILNGVRAMFHKNVSAALQIAFGAMVTLYLVMQIVVVPIHIFGGGTYFTWVGIIGVCIAIMYVALLLFNFLFNFGILGKLGSEISEKSVPIILITQHVKGWKQKFCPIIRENVSTADR